MAEGEGEEVSITCELLTVERARFRNERERNDVLQKIIDKKTQSIVDKTIEVSASNNVLKRVREALGAEEGEDVRALAKELSQQNNELQDENDDLVDDCRKEKRRADAAELRVEEYKASYDAMRDVLEDNRALLGLKTGQSITAAIRKLVG